ncbi:MAG TPA: hypothetical protein VHG72_20375, partial [Polyangia bacterium]|nr:hypothetical protein [Polyangia bacterium]
MLSRDMRVFLALPLFLLAFPAMAAPPAPAATGLRLTAAADGALEIHDGATLVTRVALQTPALRRGTPVLRDVSVDDHRLAELRVPVRGGAGEEVWIGEVSGGARRVIWSGLTGPRDADGETAVWVDVTPERVTEYQTAAGVDRCDGLPPRLFPRAYDFEAGRFRPVMSPLPPPGGQTLVARRGDPAMPAGRPIADFHFVGASTTRGAGSDARGLTPPVELEDGDPGTAWAEGLGGDGRGEFLTARAVAGGYAVRGIRIFPGDGAGLPAFKAKNRIKRLQIALGPSPAQRFDVEIPADPAADPARWREPYWIALPKPTVTSCVSVIITAVTPGTEAAPPKRYGTTAIGDLAIFTDADGAGGPERLVTDLASSADCGSRLPMVVALGAAAVQPAAQAALAAGPGPGRECLIEALTTLEPAPKTPGVVEALAAAVAGASEKEERLLAAALPRAAPPPVMPLSAMLASTTATVDDRARAARFLGLLDDAGAATALLAAVGNGPPAVRAAVVQAVAQMHRLGAEAVLPAF